LRRKTLSRKQYRNKDGKFFEKQENFRKKLTYLTILNNKRKFGKDFKHQHKTDRINNECTQTDETFSCLARKKWTP